MTQPDGDDLDELSSMHTFGIVGRVERLFRLETDVRLKFPVEPSSAVEPAQDKLLPRQASSLRKNTNYGMVRETAERYEIDATALASMFSA